MHSLYLLINLSAVAVPFLFSFHPKIRFYTRFRAVWPALLIPAAAFLLWDALFTARGVWGFNPRYISGLYLFNLPLEEVLFFICIPYACLFTYHCIHLFYRIVWPVSAVRITGTVLSALLLAIGLLHTGQAYTASVCIATALALFILIFFYKTTWLEKLLSIYPLLLIPFFIVNGLLTGTGPDEPVVWYNDAENLSLRLLTIPVEDLIYAFLLMLANIFVFERISSRYLTANPAP